MAESVLHMLFGSRVHTAASFASGTAETQTGRLRLYHGSCIYAAPAVCHKLARYQLGHSKPVARFDRQHAPTSPRVPALLWAGVTGSRTCVAGAVGVQSDPSQGQARIGHVYATTTGSLVVHQSDISQSGCAVGSDGDGATLSIGVGVTSEVGALYMSIESLNIKLWWASSFELPLQWSASSSDAWLCTTRTFGLQWQQEAAARTCHVSCRAALPGAPALCPPRLQWLAQGCKLSMLVSQADGLPFGTKGSGLRSFVQCWHIDFPANLRVTCLDKEAAAAADKHCPSTAEGNSQK